MDAQLNFFKSYSPAFDHEHKSADISNAYKESDSHINPASEQGKDESWISSTLQRVEGRVEKNSRFFTTGDGEEIRLLFMDRSKVQPKMRIRAIAFTNPVGGQYALPGTPRQIPNDR